MRRSVERRDRFDSSRAASPLRAAEDAVEVDTTRLGVEDVLASLYELVTDRGLAAMALRGGR